MGDVFGFEDLVGGGRDMTALGSTWQFDDGVQFMQLDDGRTLFQLDSDPFVDMVMLQDGSGFVEAWDQDNDQRPDLFFLHVDSDGHPDYGFARLDDHRWLVSEYNSATGEASDPVVVDSNALPAEFLALADMTFPHVDEVAEGVNVPTDNSALEEAPATEATEDVFYGPLTTQPAPWVNTGPAATGGTEIDAPTVFGDPLGEAQYWSWQGDQNYCVPASVFQIVSEYMPGVFDSVEDVVQFAADNGYIELAADGSTDGMTLYNAELLLEHATGINADLIFDGELEDLARYLANGHDVMIFVDAFEYWTGGNTDDLFHAAVITGIDFEQGVVYISDPGVKSGWLLEVPIEVFDAAWEDTGSSMLVMSEPAPADAPADSPVLETDGVPEPDVVKDDLATSPLQEPLEAPTGIEDSVEQVAFPVEAPGGSSAAVDNFVMRAFGDPEPGMVDQVIREVTNHPWVLVPVFLAAHRLGTLRKI